MLYGNLLKKMVLLPFLSITLYSLSVNAEDKPPVAVQVQPVSYQEYARPIQTSGILSYKSQQTLSFKTSGPVENILIEAGDRVAKGQRLASLAQDEIDAQVDEAINELDDIKVLKANIEDGLAVIQVEFLYGTDPQDKYDDVVAEVSRIRDTLPEDIAVLAIDRISPIDVNVLQAAMTTVEHDYLTLKNLAEKLEKRFERVPGVKKATIEALPEQQEIV